MVSGIRWKDYMKGKEVKMAHRTVPTVPDYLKILFYGQPGSTKTRTSATAAADPRTSPCLMLEAAGNPHSIRDYDQKPDVITMESLTDYNEPYNWLAAGQRKDHPFVQKFQLNPPYKSLIVDGLTEIQRMSFNLQTGSTKIGPGSFPGKVQIQHFGTVLAQMINFTKLYFSLPMHVIITSLERQDKDDLTGSIKYCPYLWGQSKTEVGGYAYIVARLTHVAILTNENKKFLKAIENTTDGNVTSVALFKPTGKYDAKDQYGMRDESGNLIDFMVNPSITKMLDAIYGTNK